MAAHAQATPPRLIPEGQNSNSNSTAVLPIWINGGNKIEALLLLEPGSPSAWQSMLAPTSSLGAGLQLTTNSGNRYRSGLSLDGGRSSLGLFCDNSLGITSLDSLAGHCQLANLQSNGAAPGLHTELGFERRNLRVTAGLGVRRFEAGKGALPISLPGGHTPTSLDNLLGGSSISRIDQKEASLLGEVKIGSQGWISIGGTVARARIISTAQLPGAQSPTLNSGLISLGGGAGNFSGSVTGRTIELPGQSGRYTTAGIGVTWRTPWRSQLSVGAESLLSKGKNPFLPAGDKGNKDEGSVPFVRYEQDL